MPPVGSLGAWRVRLSTEAVLLPILGKFGIRLPCVPLILAQALSLLDKKFPLAYLRFSDKLKKELYYER
jgi:hypothetical protein